jgi:hypothetical protein
MGALWELCESTMRAIWGPMRALGEPDESHMGTLRELSESPMRAVPSPTGAVKEPDGSKMGARGGGLAGSLEGAAAASPHADGHTVSNAPDLFRPPKLSGTGPG